MRYDFADVCRPITANEVLDVSYGRLAEIMSNRALLKASLLESETRSVAGGGGFSRRSWDPKVAFGSPRDPLEAYILDTHLTADGFATSVVVKRGLLRKRAAVAAGERSG